MSTKDTTNVKKPSETQEKKKEEKVENAQELLTTELYLNCGRIERVVKSNDNRAFNRILRQTFSRLRRKLESQILNNLLQKYFSKDPSRRDYLRHFLFPDVPQPMDYQSQHHDSEVLPEVEVYIHLLVTVFLIDTKQIEKAIECATNAVERLESWNRRTLDPLSGKVYFYYSRSYELQNRLAEIRPKLLAVQRTMTLRHNFEGQATILNLLLRNYLHYNLFDQADKLSTKTEFKEDSATSNQLARYYYYLGRINSVQLNYTEGFTFLSQALRKAPRVTARGFRATVLKLSCIVQLLMGEIPERSTFRQEHLRSALKPYLELTKSVRNGDLTDFRRVVEKHVDTFKKDKNYTLIQRLRHNVIKTSLRKINLSYSRISLKDICEKLDLESIEDTEFIVTKAIRDGIIDATVDHERGFIKSKENVDIYSTSEPQAQYHKRIRFCLDIHNEALKAMRFPPNTSKKESEKEREEREKSEKELLKSLEEEIDEED
eukprot:TRINITY_DN8175_c0_g1_i1.p1 TRINITY_DN8175_c0_g1~~TRINITY_DN8175_c0_g1_i1.p1  ORF type:complete len:489 (-),score=91.63 TRINITY_DN8175_c0_g1_i1:48-1514(-)